MDPASDQLLPGPRFSSDEDCGVDGSDLDDPLQHLAHRFRLSHDTGHLLQSPSLDASVGDQGDLVRIRTRSEGFLGPEIGSAADGICTGQHGEDGNLELLVCLSHPDRAVFVTRQNQEYRLPPPIHLGRVGDQLHFVAFGRQRLAKSAGHRETVRADQDRAVHELGAPEGEVGVSAWGGCGSR